MGKINTMGDAIQALLAAVDRQIDAAAQAKEAIEALRRLAAETLSK